MILIVLFGILTGTYVLLTALDWTLLDGRMGTSLRGRISLAVLLVFTGLGHFVMTDAMIGMLPTWVPARESIIYLTGLLEWLGAIGLLVPGYSRAAGLCLIVFLIVVFAANVHAAMNRVGIGGHQAGPIYLVARGPFQLLLIWWAWRFAVRRPGGGGALPPA